jgi:hypothetical protein
MLRLCQEQSPSIAGFCYVLSTFGKGGPIMTGVCWPILQQGPIKGHTEDAGTTTTHKNIICDLHDQGYTPPEISRITCHIPESRDRYLKTNLRVETLFRVLRRIPDEVQTARFLGIERSVARQYLQRLERNMALGDKTKPAAQGAEKPSASSPQLSGR